MANISEGISEGKTKICSGLLFHIIYFFIVDVKMMDFAFIYSMNNFIGKDKTIHLFINLANDCRAHTITHNTQSCGHAGKQTR